MNTSLKGLAAGRGSTGRTSTAEFRISSTASTAKCNRIDRVCDFGVGTLQATAIGQPVCKWMILSRGTDGRRELTGTPVMARYHEFNMSIEGAAEAIRQGQLDTLERLLNENPAWAQERSVRALSCTSRPTSRVTSRTVHKR